MPAAAPDPSDVRFPSIEGLRAFESVARLGSCERAADELSVTASAISKRVATLEDLLGTPLFNRSLRTLALTAAGREYLDQVRAALGLLAAVPLHRRQAQRVQRLRVSSPPTFARQILVPALTDYTAAHPAVELEIVLSIPYIDGGQADADVEIRNGDALAAGVDPLMEDVLVPLASPGLLARLGPIVVPADLAQAPLLRTPLEPWTPWFRAAGLDWHEPTQGPRLVDLGLTLEAAVCGQGVALARPSLARHWLRSGALVPVLPALGITARPAHLYYAVAHSAHEPAFGFIDWLAAMASDLAQEAAQELLSRSG